jgi:type VII secretion-associated serine protease mycosin
VKLWRLVASRAITVWVALTAIVIASDRVAHADPIRDQQWHLAFLDVATAHRTSQGEGTLVAVVDTGVDASHPDLAGAVTVGMEFGQPGDGRSDTDGHGTAMAGLISGRGRGAAGGVLGIAPRSTIMPVRTLPGGPVGGDPANLGAGIRWAVENGAKVICVAAITSEDPAINTAIEAAAQADIVIVAGVGNLPGDSRVGYPARLPGVLAVGGVDRAGNHAPISATGPEVALVAPAVEIVSTGAFGQYTKGTGTSEATAIVAGAAALVRARFPHLSAADVIHRLTATAVDRGPPGRDEQYGYGILNLVAALTADVPPRSALPSPPVRADPPDRTSRALPIIVTLAVAGAVVVLVVAIRRARQRHRQRTGSRSQA